MTARIIGIASYLPERILSNSDLEEMVDTSDEWIVTRTGMKERRVAEQDECTSHMGASAGRKAIEKAGIAPSEIQAVLVGTMTPDYPCPSTAALIQDQLGIQGAFGMDFGAACTGFIYGLSLAKAYIESGMYDNILLIASEKLTPYINYKDRNTCILFGDGAAAVVISSKGKGLQIGNTNLGTDGAQSELIQIQGGGTRNPPSQATIDKRMHYISMSGKEVFKHAVRRMENAINSCLEKSALKEEEISWLVPHQANIRIVEGLAKRFSVPEERVFKVIHKYGNTSASSVAIALDELLQENEVTEGENLMLVAFGGGLTWGASVLTQVAS